MPGSIRSIDTLKQQAIDAFVSSQRITPAEAVATLERWSDNGPLRRMTASFRAWVAAVIVTHYRHGPTEADAAQAVALRLVGERSAALKYLEPWRELLRGCLPECLHVEASDWAAMIEHETGELPEPVEDRPVGDSLHSSADPIPDPTSLPTTTTPVNGSDTLTGDLTVPDVRHGEPYLPQGAALLQMEIHRDSYKLAGQYARAELIPSRFHARPLDAWVTIQHGLSLGLTPIQALIHITVIKGNPTVKSDTAIALCRRSPACEWIRRGECTDTTATYIGKRRDDPDPASVTWTIADAKRADLASKDNWRKYPRQMLRARAQMELCRSLFQEVLAGVYCADEVE